MPTERLNGIDLYWEQQGRGPRLLKFNGSGSSIAEGRPIFDLLAGSFDVVLHDQRGLGATEIPPGPYSMAEYAADAIALLDHLGWDSCRVIGISFGGMVAQEFAVTVPERVERLALVCTSPGGAGGSSYPLHELADMDEAERAALGPWLMDTRFTAEWLAEHPGDRALVEAMNGRRQPDPSSDAARGARLQLEARSHHDVWDRLPSLTMPTLVAAGRYDGIAALANAEAMAERIPNAELRVYEGGHAFFAQDPRAFPEIIDFLKG